MDLNQKKFLTKTERAAHNMMILAFFPLIVCLWQAWMALADNSAGSWGGALLFGLLVAGYISSSWFVRRRMRGGWYFAAAYLVFMAASLFFFAKIDWSGPEAIFVYIWPAVNLYVLYLLVADRKNYFAANGKPKK